MEFEVEAGKEELITVDEGEEEGAGWDKEELGVVLFNSSLGTGVSDLGSLVCCIGGQSITLHMYFFFLIQTSDKESGSTIGVDAEDGTKSGAEIFSST